MNLKAVLTGIGLASALLFAAVPRTGSNLRFLGRTAASAEEHQEANENDPAAEDKELSSNIRREKKEGNDVSAAIAAQNKGEAALKAGDKKGALEAFEQGEHALDAGEEHEKGETGGY